MREPRAVLSEFGTTLPDNVEVRVHDSTADMRYLVLPERPAGTEGWSEERLAALISRDSMIGVTRPNAGAEPAATCCDERHIGGAPPMLASRWLSAFPPLMPRLPRRGLFLCANCAAGSG